MTLGTHLEGERRGGKSNRKEVTEFPLTDAAAIARKRIVGDFQDAPTKKTAHIPTYRAQLSRIEVSLGEMEK